MKFVYLKATKLDSPYCFQNENRNKKEKNTEELPDLDYSCVSDHLKYRETKSDLTEHCMSTLYVISSGK